MATASMGFVLGRLAGWAIAPVFGFVSFARHARTFHPCGPVLRAHVRPHPDATLPGDAATQLRALAERLAGPALVRFSGALWKRAENVPDVLGCALRLRRDETETARPDEDDQDLLFATIVRPWTMPIAPFTTDVADYLANDYFAVSPFDAGLGHSVYLRLQPERHPDGAGTGRDERLTRAVARGHGRLVLQLAQGPFGPWVSLVHVILDGVTNVDGEALRFRPFRAGRGLRPRGFVHALRVGVYALSQRARPARSGAPSR